MKNSKEYAGKIAKFFKAFKTGKPHLPRYKDPVEAMIFGILSEVMPEPKARSVFAAIQENFVDWNDLRVSRLEEISEVLREETETAERITSHLNQSLNYIFREYDTVSLSMLFDLGKRPARKFLEEKMPGLSRFVIDYIMLTALDAHSIPLTRKMQDYLKNSGLVEASATEDEIEGFLQRQIPASDAYQFYITLRKACEKPGGEKAVARMLVKTAQARASAAPAKTTKKKLPAKGPTVKKHHQER
jgi:endonuclease III